MKRVKNFIIEAKTNLLPCSLTIAVGDENFMSKNLTDAGFAEYIELVHDKANGVCITHDGVSLILMKDFGGGMEGVLAHEIFHAVHKGLEYCMIQLDGNAAGEVFGYLTSFYTEAFYDGLREKFKKI
jgi:hypothetical protein